MTVLYFKGVAAGLGGASVLDGLDFSLEPGEFVALLGANGAGKTTLLKAALGFVSPSAGEILLNGENPSTMPPAIRARKVAYLPQTRPLAWPIRVRDVVTLGRFSFGVSMGKLAHADAQAIDRAIAACGLTGYEDRSTAELSGGELARVHMARALASEAPVLLADEPVAALDPLYQWQVMEVMRNFVNNGGAALVILHDASLAARYADRLVFLREGRVVADGPPGETLTVEILRETYGISAQLGELAGAPVMAVTGPA